MKVDHSYGRHGSDFAAAWCNLYTVAILLADSVAQSELVSHPIDCRYPDFQCMEHSQNRVSQLMDQVLCPFLRCGDPGDHALVRDARQGCSVTDTATSQSHAVTQVPQSLHFLHSHA